MKSFTNKTPICVKSYWWANNCWKRLRLITKAAVHIWRDLNSTNYSWYYARICLMFYSSRIYIWWYGTVCITAIQYMLKNIPWEQDNIVEINWLMALSHYIRYFDGVIGFLYFYLLLFYICMFSLMGQPWPVCVNKKYYYYYCYTHREWYPTIG